MRPGYRIRPAYRLRGKVQPQNVCWCRSGAFPCEPSPENEEQADACERDAEGDDAREQVDRNDAREQVDRDDAREQVDRDDAHKRADDAEQAMTWRFDVPRVPIEQEVELFGERSGDEESVETLILGEP